MKDKFPSVNILGSKVNLLDISQVVEIIEHWINTDDDFCRQIIVTGFHGLWEAYRNPQLKSILNSADLWVPDGIAPVIIARLKGHKYITRTPGVDIMKAFFEIANQKGYSSYFYGDTEETLEKLSRNIKETYPGHRIAGMYSPPFRPLTQSEDEEIISIINDSNPDIVWVGLGMTKQDRWGFEHKKRLNAKIVIGVGAAYRFLAGKIKRAPRWIGDYGFEWLWRFAMEPKKLWRRDIIDGPQFWCHVALELLKIKRYNYKQDYESIDV